VKPEIVLKGGFIAWAQMGDPNASIPTPQPVSMRPMFGGFGRAPGATGLAFVSQLSLDAGVVQRYGLHKRPVAVRGCRTVSKRDMKLNDALPRITVDPERYIVTADGVRLESNPAAVLPLAQRYFLF
jgi:urease subunit alpha